MRIETTLKASFLDAGGISNRWRRASLTLGCSTPCFFYVYSVFVVSLATVVTSVDVSSRKMVVVESYSVWLLIYGFGVTRSNHSWGVPLSSSSTASFIFRKRRISTYPPTTNAELPTGDYQPHFGERIVRCYGSGFYRSDLPPNPPLASHSLSLMLSHGESFNPRRPLPRFKHRLEFAVILFF
ncbi:hypothetical protein IGI04_005439 [Brassica rapa subsp. trilocularis]|uniref:Uncharacterized protein n=1 Tax=Brassica rapa subsp. trilocularis TaxID=1813537 RepID=A0ABQ7NGD5_BRACM|nr:hypothetical protein IGI04_005439 [Brassica rapa subsp. trilocularis]